MPNMSLSNNRFYLEFQIRFSFSRKLALAQNLEIFEQLPLEFAGDNSAEGKEIRLSSPF